MPFLDREWFPILREADPTLITKLKLSGQEQDKQREYVLSNYARVNPSFSGKYNISTAEMDNKWNRWQEIKDLVEAYTPGASKMYTAVWELYKAKLDEVHLKLRLLDAVLQQDDEKFYQNSRELYGTLDPALVKYFWECLDFSSLEKSSHQDVFRFLQEIGEEVQFHLRNVTPINGPSQNFPHTIPAWNDQDVLDALEVKSYFEKFLADCGFSNNWTVEIDRDGGRQSFSVQVSKQKVWIPRTDILQNRMVPVTAQNVWAKAYHEIGVHAWRYEQGTDEIYSPLLMLRLGLPNYLTNEEGLGLVWEAHHNESPFFADSWRRALSLAFADGTLTGVPQDFKNTLWFEACLRVCENSQLSQEEALRESWPETWRKFRGGAPSTGIVFYKEGVYPQGEYNISQAPFSLNENWLYRGKFNPLDSFQVQKLTELGLFE